MTRSAPDIPRLKNYDLKLPIEMVKTSPASFPSRRRDKRRGRFTGYYGWFVAFVKLT